MIYWTARGNKNRHPAKYATKAKATVGRQVENFVHAIFVRTSIFDLMTTNKRSSANFTLLNEFSASYNPINKTTHFHFLLVISLNLDESQ